MYEKSGSWLRAVTILLAVVLLCAAVPRASAKESTKMLIPVGHTVGIKLFSRGVVVVKPPEDGTPAEECGLQSGDVIVGIGETPVTSIEQFRALLQESGAQDTQLQVQREDDAVTLTVAPEENDAGVYCIGAWIRDSMAGIGTMTYYDPDTGVFGALGHGITDVDTAQLMPFADGSILPSEVKAVKKGESGAAGELKGNFDLTQTLGKLTANTEVGIFGVMEACPFDGKAFPVGQAVVGPAVIRANVAGDTVGEYEIDITHVSADSKNGRELVLEITDPELLACTGGIVQGMSGSPIIQNGEIVGAVTHVLLNDPARGYGVLIGTMLEASA